MAKSRQQELKERLNICFQQMREVRGYFIYSHGAHDEGVFCRDLDAVEKHIKKMEDELNG